jgi:hypothetical protein
MKRRVSSRRPKAAAERRLEHGLIDQVREQALRSLSWRQRQSTNLYLMTDVLRGGAAIRAHRQKIAVERPTVMVFADDAPQLNWGHACRYLLFDAATGERYASVAAQFPPFLTNPPDTFRPFHEPVRIDPSLRVWPLRPLLRCPIRRPKGRRYAVLFSGASNNRHVNDMEFLYRTLRDVYLFREEDIRVLNYDGTLNYAGGPMPIVAWPGDNTGYQMPVHGRGTKADLDAVLDDLKGHLKPDDFLLIHTNNHGGWDGWGKAYLVTYSGPDYYAQDFGAKLAQLPRFHCLMTMMEQCHSGGFNGPIVANSPADHTSIASACVEDQNSIGGAHFDPFARDWIAAVTGHDPYGGALASNPDSDGSGKVSAREAFNYADSIHDPYDTPVYDSTSSTADKCHLGRRYVWWWWWFCPLVHEVLYPYYVKLPPSVFNRRMQEQLTPELDRIADRLEKRDTADRKAVERSLRQLVAKAFD